MTEEEAKTKWCPMAKMWLLAPDVYAERTELLHKQRNDAGNHCIGSACMMWRRDIANDVDRGYCGLAGKP